MKSSSSVSPTSGTLPTISATKQPTESIGRHRVCDVLLWIFRIFGVWHTPHTSNLYRAYALLVQIGGTVIYTVTVCAGFIIQSNLYDRLHASSMMLELVALSLKLLNMFWYMSEWQMVLADCERFELRAHRGSTAEERAYVRERQRFYVFFVCSFFAMGNSTIITLYVGSWLGGKVPFVAWYPGLDPTYGQPEFVWVYVYQVIGMVMMCNVNLVVEMFASYVMVLMAVRLELIGRRLARLGWSPTDLGRLRVTGAEQAQSRRILRECVQLHQDLLRMVALFERTYSKGIFAQISLSGTIMCLNAVLLTFTSATDNPVLYAYYFFFFIAVTVQIYLPCFFGNELLLASEQLPRHAYGSNWPLLGQRFARLQLVFVERSQRTVQVMVVKLFPLKLQTFTSIGSFSYRLYAVLKR